MNKKQRKKWTGDDLQLFLLSLPTVLWYVLFCYLPLFGLIIAFKKYQVVPGKGFLYSLIHSEWSGLENFRFLFATNRETTVNMFVNTLGYNLVFIVLDIVLPVTLAIMISNLKSKKLAKTAQTACCTSPIIRSTTSRKITTLPFPTGVRHMLFALLRHLRTCTSMAPPS